MDVDEVANVGKLIEHPDSVLGLGFGDRPGTNIDLVVARVGGICYW